MDTFAEQARRVDSDNAMVDRGEMGRLMQLSDWSTSPCSAEPWPQSLRTAIDICLASRFPIIIFCGQELRQFYNDAYRPILGKTKHPQALGQRAEDCWPEIWDEIGPMLYGVLTHGDATWSENLLLPLDRNGYVEECYFTFSCSPIRAETGAVCGVFCAVTETTGKVLGARRLRTLRALAANTAEAHSAEEVCRMSVSTLADNPADLPFTLLYLLNSAGTQAHLAGSAGVPEETFASPAVIHLDNPSAPWPFAKVAKHNHGTTLNDLLLRFSSLDPFEEGDNPTLHSALVLPITRSAEDRAYGFLVAGINPRRRLDDDYRGFLTLVAGQVATAVASARAFQETQKRAEARLEIARLRQESISPMDEFIGIAGHELRTPLTAIKGNVQLAQRRLGRVLKQETALSEGLVSAIASVQDSLERIERQVTLQNRLVNDLLDVSRIQTGRLELQCERHDLAAIVREVVEDQRLLTPARTIRLDSPSPGEVPVLADADRVRQVVNNYLSNALKYSEASSPIIVGVERMGTQARVLVSDQGPGLSQADQQRVWERFYRALSVENKGAAGVGLGLGLHISRMIIEQHSGQVGVESEPGKGSTFWFTLPLAQSESS